MSRLSAPESGAPSDEPPLGARPHASKSMPSRQSYASFLNPSRIALCACTGVFGAALTAHALAQTQKRNFDRGNFVHLVANGTAASNFIVIRSLAKGASSALTSMAQATPSEVVDLDAGRLESFVTLQRLALRPVFLHLSQQSGRFERRTVVGLRDDEVWRYEIGGASRKVSRLGILVPVSDGLRKEHERAVVDSMVVLAYRPTIDLPNGDAVAEAGTPVFTFLKTGNAFFQVNRSGEGSFTISQIGVLTAAP